jgi:hypothetical protein
MRFNLDLQSTPAWLDRADKCVDLLAQLSGRGGLRVCDLGCGDQKLRRVLEQRRMTVDYKGFDLKPQSADVETLDLESRLPPVATDVTVLLGVIEYISDLNDLFARLAAWAPALVVSHVTRDGSKYSERELKNLGWRNHLPAAQVERMLAGAGWMVEANRKTDDERTRLWLAKSRMAAR